MYLALRPRGPLFLWFFLWLSCALVPACKQDANSEVCCTTDEDCARLGGILPRGCPDGFVCRDLLCESSDCAAASDCTAEQPVCDLGAASCTGCSVAADCAGYADAPVCDAVTGGCRACALDAECPSEVCDVDSGRCVEEADVIYASANGADTAGCTHAQPCSLVRALVVAGADPASSLVRLLPGTYTTQVSLSTGTTVLVGSGATLTGSYPLEARESAVVEARGFEIYGNVLSMSQSSLVPSLTLRDITLRGTGYAEHGILRMRRSRVFNAQYVASVRDDGVFDADRVRFECSTCTLSHAILNNLGRRQRVYITNSIFDRVSLNMSNTDVEPDRSEYHVLFNTFVLSTSFSCVNTGYPRVANLSNNIFYSTSAQVQKVIDGSDCTLTGNIAYPQTPPLGGTNLTADPAFSSLPDRDFRIRAESPALNAAVPASGANLEHDFAGTPRPQGDRKDIGAFERAP